MTRQPTTPTQLAVVRDSIAGGDDREREYVCGSYLTALRIIEGNERGVLGAGACLEYDEMAGRVMLNRRPLEDVDEHRVRGEIERRFDVDSKNTTKGLRVTIQDVRAALEQVARSRSYHPVRRYLQSLRWDGVPRLASVADDILGAQRTALNQALIRRFMVSAVARAMQPGCKVDTVLILVGKQGGGKSSFFATLGGEWFIDTALDITTPKAFMTLRRTWIYEWAELEVVRRAKDINAVKSFVTSRVDSYVPSYAHHPVDVPRSFVVVGSTNTDEFLIDDENRRFWPLRVGTVNLKALREQRDQLWAEAVHVYTTWSDAGADASTTPWVLTQTESEKLVDVHAEHAATDAWADAVLSYAEKHLSEFTTADLLEHAVKKPQGQWGKGDEMRVATIMKRGGWKLSDKKPKGRSRPWERVRK